MILLIYVNNMLIAEPDEKAIKEMKEKLLKTFEIKDLGATKKIFRMSIVYGCAAGTLTVELMQLHKKGACQVKHERH